MREASFVLMRLLQLKALFTRKKRATIQKKLNNTQCIKYIV